MEWPTRLRNTWFGFLVFVIILLLPVCLWVNAPFCMISWAAPRKFGLSMVVDVLATTPSLRFLWNLQLPGGIVLRKPRFVSLFCFVGGARACVLSLNFTSESVLLTNGLLIASLHEIFFFNVVMFSSNVLSVEFVLRSLRVSPLTKPFLTPGGWHVVKNVYWNVSVG